MALRSTDLAILSARFGVARFGASRFGFCPDNVEGVGADEPGEYAWKEDKPSETLWTLQTLYSFCGARPVCSFTIDDAEVAIAATVTFTDTSTPAELISYWYWTFGDGEVSYEQNPTHAYASAGTFTVTLYVAGIRGSCSTTDTVDVIAAPVASFDYVKEEAATNVEFTDTSTGNIDTLAWVFASGDPATSVASTPTIEWTVDSTYTVTLTVTGPGGSDAATFEFVFVEAEAASGSVS